MNNHKIFKWIQILLCISPLFVPSWATIRYDKASVTVFHNQVGLFVESEVLKSLQTTQNIFGLKEVETASFVGLLAGIAYPPLKDVTTVIFILRALLASESDWRVAFSKTIHKETTREIVLNNVQLMEASIMIIQKKMVLLSPNNTDIENRKTVASIFHTEIDRLLHFFADSDSLFRKYPLIGTPPLVALALFVANFEPIAQALIPLEANSSHHSCEMRNILLDYRPRAVYARLEKMRLTQAPVRKLSSDLLKTMSIQYNQYGYNTTIPATIGCERGCREGWLQRKSVFDTCVKDDFGEEYSGSSCSIDYALLLRHRVEKLFPIELLNRYCKTQPEATGFGWLTIKLTRLGAHKTWENSYCDWVIMGADCDPFVKLFIDGELVLTTDPKTDECCYELDVTHTTKRISKSALVKIEIFDSDWRDSEELIFRTEGNIDSFLRSGHRGTARGQLWLNYIYTVSFWQDELVE